MTGYAVVRSIIDVLKDFPLSKQTVRLQLIALWKEIENDWPKAQHSALILTRDIFGGVTVSGDLRPQFSTRK